MQSLSGRSKLLTSTLLVSFFFAWRRLGPWEVWRGHANVRHCRLWMSCCGNFRCVCVCLSDMLMNSSETNPYQLNVAMLTRRWNIASRIWKEKKKKVFTWDKYSADGCGRLSPSCRCPLLCYFWAQLQQNFKTAVCRQCLEKRKDIRLNFGWLQCGSQTGIWYLCWPICLLFLLCSFGAYSTVIIIIIQGTRQVPSDRQPPLSIIHVDSDVDPPFESASVHVAHMQPCPFKTSGS